MLSNGGKEKFRESIRHLNSRKYSSILKAARERKGVHTHNKLACKTPVRLFVIINHHHGTGTVHAPVRGERFKREAKTSGDPRGEKMGGIVHPERHLGEAWLHRGRVGNPVRRPELRAD